MRHQFNDLRLHRVEEADSLSTFSCPYPSDDRRIRGVWTGEGRQRVSLFHPKQKQIIELVPDPAGLKPIRADAHTCQAGLAAYRPAYQHVKVEPIT